MNKNPIGVFDSGVGGTSIWNEIHTILPNENTIYLADSKNAPYGPKGKEKIIELCIKNTELLLKKKCKLIVVACNTATTNAISQLRQRYDVPFIGIEPAIKPAALKSRTKVIGILATKGTLSSSLFSETSGSYSKGIHVVEEIGKGIVELIEEGQLESEEMTILLQKYLKPMLEDNIDTLVLGCTHYAYLIPKLRAFLPHNIKILDSGSAVAKQTKKVMTDNYMINKLIKKPHNLFYSNANPDVLQSLIGSSYRVSYLDF